MRLVTPLPAGEGQGARESTYAYDPLGRRIERTVNGETTSYLYDGNQAIGEVRAGQTTMLLTGLDIDEAIARYAPSGRLTQLTDQLGSVIRQINEAGLTQSTTAYSPYGEATTAGDDQGNSTEYTGRENDGTGLYFYRARYYDQIGKRWISEDPIGTAGGINIYAYVANSPINQIDPLGLANSGPWPRPKPDPTPPDYSPCEYYDGMSKSTGCTYYPLAAGACRSTNPATSSLMRLCGASNAQQNKIRQCLVEEDKKARNNPNCKDKDCSKGNGNCVKSSCIDSYHYKCFEDVGVDPKCYGGYWVPLDRLL